MAHLPSADELGRGSRIEQGYLAADGRVDVRLRRSEGRATLTIKSAAALTRTEVELPVAPRESDELWELTGGRRIEKVRHRVDVGEHVAEVDVFGGALHGLVLVEVEFEDEATAGTFVPPAWFGREVTGEGAWSNSSLALHGLPR